MLFSSENVLNAVDDEDAIVVNAGEVRRARGTDTGGQIHVTANKFPHCQCAHQSILLFSLLSYRTTTAHGGTATRSK